MFNARTKSIVINGYSMDYISFGKGNKWLILIPGLSINRIRGHALQMSFMYRQFARKYKVLMFDRRDHLTPSYSIGQMADELYSALRKLGIYKTDVVGISEGGMIAQKLAINQPDIVHKLVLAVTISEPNNTSNTTIKQWISLAKNNQLKELVWDSFQRSYSTHYIHKHHHLLKLLATITKVKEVDRFIILAQAILNFNVAAQLTKIKCPVFVIGAQQDQVLSVEGTKTIAKILHAPLYIYPHYGHTVYIEAKDFNQRIYNFLMS